MPTSVTISGPYFSGSGEISFSALRNNFKEVSSGVVAASEFFRNTFPDSLNPIVPDSAENAGISSSGDGNLTLGQFRDSVKSYNVVQTGTDLNLNIDNLNWSGNLTSNILKRLVINGTVGSNDATQYAATLTTDNVSNLIIDIFGNIYGASGDGGNISGQNGGSGLYVSSTDSQALSIFIRDTAKVYAGGGGGEKGVNGSKGANGTCTSYTTRSSCGSYPGCPSGWSSINTWSGSCCQTYCQWCGWSRCACQPCSQWQKYRQCRLQYTAPGGAGGVGGNGGPGRGYDNFSGSLSGSPGSPGGGGSGCGSQPGSPGSPGGSGGDWASPGTNTANTGSAGGPGLAIVGNGYVVNGTINSTTVKGTYQPSL